MTQSFRDMHRPGAAFIMPNAWDIGSARVLAGLGAQAIGTTSAGFAFTQGVGDMGNLTRDQTLTHCADMAAAVNVPVSGDLENGFGDAPEECADTVRLAAEAGLAGLCLEDVTPDAVPYPRALAIDRMRAAADAARAVSRDILLVARADGVMHGAYDLAEAIARVQGFEATGVDAIYVPMPGGKLADMAALRSIVQATKLPVNALVAGPWTAHTQAEFAAAGVARLSVGSAFARKVQAHLITTAKAVLSGADFDSLGGSATFPQLEQLFKMGER